jgi:DNA (cytosine-5)-methyltransferase 1
VSRLVYGSVCSGIEAASVAWHPLGWRAAFLSEIEPFPRAALAHHYPDVPLHGDFTTIEAGQYEPIDLLVGGTPCQSFSVAGLRGGLADDRGNLALQFLRLADRLRPRWVVWENVPGVLSSNDGRDFGSILGGLAELGYGWAYRVLDAQFFGIPQRRRRVFVVGCLGDWRRAVAVLFERHSLSGHPAPRREAGQAAPTIPSRSTAGGGLGTDFDCDGGYQPSVAGALGTEVPGSRQRADASDNLLVARVLHVSGDQANSEVNMDLAGTLNCTEVHGVVYGWNGDETPKWGREVSPTLRAEQGGEGLGVAIPFDTTQITSDKNYSRPRAGGTCHPRPAGAHPPAIAFTCKDHGADAGDVAPTLRGMGHDASHPNGGGQLAVAFNWQSGGDCRQNPTVERTDTLGAHQTPPVFGGMAVRRLTPRECERLQGFPDDYTLIPYRGKPAADGPRYKALGNSMAVPVMAWIGRRIQMVEELAQDTECAA